MLVDEHTPRAEEHARQAAFLASTGSEWAAVAYFYAAYHRARQALRSDPVFYPAVWPKYSLLHQASIQGFGIRADSSCPSPR